MVQYCISQCSQQCTNHQDVRQRWRAWTSIAGVEEEPPEKQPCAPSRRRERHNQELPSVPSKVKPCVRNSREGEGSCALRLAAGPASCIMKQAYQGSSRGSSGTNLKRRWSRQEGSISRGDNVVDRRGCRCSKSRDNAQHQESRQLLSAEPE
jgi:hypothetical protein